MAGDKKMEISRDRVSNYERSVVGTGESKRRVIDNGDEVSLMMREVATDDELRALAVQYNLTERFDGWSHLNRGQRRMNLGNSLRHVLRKRREAESVKSAA